MSELKPSELFTDKEVKAAYELRNSIIDGTMKTPIEARAIYIAGEIVMWDMMRSKAAPTPPTAPSTPPNAAGAEGAELQTIVRKVVDRIAEWDGFAANSIKGNTIGGIVLDVLMKQSYATHTAAKAVEDERARLRGLVEERIASLTRDIEDQRTDRGLIGQLRLMRGEIQVVRTWLAG